MVAKRRHWGTQKRGRRSDVRTAAREERRWGAREAAGRPAPTQTAGSPAVREERRWDAQEAAGKPAPPQTAGSTAGSATGSVAEWLLSEDSHWTAREVLWILGQRLVSGYTDWDAGAALCALELRRDELGAEKPITASWVRPADEVRRTLHNYVCEHAHLHDYYVQEDPH